MTPFDTYTLRARVAPFLVVASPMIVFAASAWFTKPVIGLVGSFASVAILLGSQLARDAGRRIQDDMWARWGGPPTLRKLQYRGGQAEARVSRIHSQLETALGTALPTQADESTDSDAADAAYEDAIGHLRELTRDRKVFNLLFKENINYGFRRNLLGLRGWGIATASAVVVASILFGFLMTGKSAKHIVTAAVPGVWAAILLTLFVLVVTEDWVRLCAEAYADRLVGAAHLVGKAPADGP
jgi:hypothetical protein